MKEADLKRQISDYLECQANLGRLLFLRLNAGSFVLTKPNGSFQRRVKGCPKGTSDFFILQDGCPKFIEIKGEGGKQSNAQKEFAERVTEQKGWYYVIFNLDELRDVLE